MNMRVRRTVTRWALVWVAVASLAPLGAGAKRLAPVHVAPAERQTIVETLNLTGTLTSPNTAQLAPDVEGRIVEIKVDAGDRVKAGDTLFRLDDELAGLELQQAIAAEHEAATNLADAERRLSEVRDLVERRSFPESEARGLAAQVERNRALHERRKAERAHAAAMLERHTLNAPFDGVIATREAGLGERVDANSRVLNLVAVDRLQLDLQVPQGYFQRVAEDTPITVQVDALPGQSFATKVSRIVPVSDSDARTFLVRAYLNNEAVRMIPGMSVRAVLRIGTGRAGVVVPRDALIRYPDGRTIIWVALGSGVTRTVQERVVRTGVAFDGKVEIVEGVDEGEAVVVRGNEALQQDQEVRVAELD